MMVRAFRRRDIFAFCVVATLTVAGCAVSQEMSRTPRTTIEQLLLSQAVERSLNELTLPIPSGESILVEVSGFQTDRAHVHLSDVTQFGVIDNPSWDLSFVRDRVAGRLGELGYRLPRRQEGVTYLVRVLVQTLGTVQGETTFGMPPVQSVLLPFSLPALTLFGRQTQMATARFSIDIFELESGRFVRSTPWYDGTAYFSQYTLLFFLTFRLSDLVLPAD